MEPLDLLTDECMQNGAEKQHLELHELKSYDPYATMEKSDKSLHHVVDKVERFEKDNNHHQFTPPSGWDLDNAERRKEQVEKQLEKVRAWCKKDRTIPIMTVFGDCTYQWLVPLPLSKLQETPTLVALLHPTRTDESDQPCYILKTVLTLDMALMQARLCGKIHQKWTVSKRQSEAWRRQRCGSPKFQGSTGELGNFLTQSRATSRSSCATCLRWQPWRIATRIASCSELTVFHQARVRGLGLGSVGGRTWLRIEAV